MVGVILVTLGVLILLDKTDVVDFSNMFRTYWPLLHCRASGYG